MKRIPKVTTIIALISLILFGIFIVSYNSYTNNLHDQFEAQAATKLSRVNGTTRATLDLRLSNQLRDLETIASAMRQTDLEYASPSFSEKLSDLSNNTLRVFIIDEPKDLDTYIENTELRSDYYDRLINGSPVFTNTYNTVFFLYPYSYNNEVLTVLIKEYEISKFSELINFKPTEYNCTCYLINSSGKILASNADFTQYDNYFTQIEKIRFSKNHSYKSFIDDLFSPIAGITHYETNDNDIYAYYSPTYLHNLFLVHTVPSSLIDQDSKEISAVSRNFMNTVLVVIFLLVIGLLFFCVIYTMKINKNRDSLLLEQQRYRIALSHSKDAIWEYDIKTDTLTKSDASFGLYTGIKTIHPFQETIEQCDIIMPEDRERFHDFCNSLLTDVPEYKVEIRARNKNGEYEWFELFATKLFDSDNKPISVIGQTCNINNQKLEFEQLKDKAGQDTLTKLYNRMTVCSKVEELISSIDSPVILGFLIIDIDNFKGLNEKLGHLFGDAVLIDVGGRLKKLFQSYDIVGRVGGDEFIVVIYNAPSITFIEDMAKKTTNILHGIYTGDESNLELTCSIGISLYPSDGNSFETLYENAEIAMYQAKMRGRNQVAFFDSSMTDLSKLEVLQKKRTKIETNYQHEERSLIDSAIIANAIDILFDSREIDVSINMMLSLIGIYYNISCANIFEYGQDGTTISITHEWYSNADYKSSDYICNIPSEELEQYSFYKQAYNGVMYCDNMSELFQSSNVNSRFKMFERTNSFFQCGISDHGKYIGFISFSICDEPHQWIKSEIDSLSLLSKIIGSYLIRLRSMQKADLITQKDLLTNAYNFNTFLNVVNQQLKQHPEQSYAIIYCDIFQFKLINDNYGYQAGDEILKHLSDILSTVGGEQSILCRITGDKFALLLSYEDIDDLSRKAEEILILSKQISSFEGGHYKINVIIGIYVMSDNDSAIVAVDRANIARKNAQKLRKENYKFFNENMRSALIEQKNIEDVMEEALRDGQFSVYYQPKINMNTGQICGAEALVRWNRPDVGIVPPSSFVPLFEDNGFITQLDYFVLDSVCSHLKDKIDHGIKVYPVSVNFSREHFKTSTLPEFLQKTANKYGIPPNLIEVEITESAFVNIDRYWAHILQRIRKLGFGLAMDDFGSGLSSLNLLSDLPFKVLKIDKDFFHSKTTHKRERIVISNIVRMAQELDMEVICEGVETFEQAMFLQSIGCYMAQGYYYDKPLPLEVFDLKYFNFKRS